MKTRAERRVAVRYRWDRLKVSFWFASVVMALSAILLAWAMYRVDNLIPNEMLQNSNLVLSGTVSELRTTLVTIATTTLATAGVVFTLLTLPLSTVAAQYGSRLLRLFLGDRTTQFVLGMFVGTFVYCITAALSIPATQAQPEAPQLTATLGVYLMLATFATLILLVQHISTMLQAPNIAAAAGAELQKVINTEISNEVTSGDGGQSGVETSPDSPSVLAEPAEAESYPLRARSTGYIQTVDPEIMLTLAREKALVWPASRVDEQLAGQLSHAFQIGNGRTPTQDVEYAVNQLTEMAVRAMSPAINDPFTSMTCLDHLADGLVKFILHLARGSHFIDRVGIMRLMLEP